MTWSILLFIVEIYTVPLNDVDEYYKFCFNCPLYNSPKSIAFHFFFGHLFFGQFLIVVVSISLSVSSFLHWSNFNITNFDHDKIGRFFATSFPGSLRGCSFRVCFILHGNQVVFPTWQANLRLISRIRSVRVSSRYIFVNSQFISNPLLCCVYVVRHTVLDLCSFSQFTVLSNSQQLYSRNI